MSCVCNLILRPNRSGLPHFHNVCFHNMAFPHHVFPHRSIWYRVSAPKFIIFFLLPFLLFFLSFYSVWCGNAMCKQSIRDRAVLIKRCGIARCGKVNAETECENMAEPTNQCHNHDNCVYQLNSWTLQSSEQVLYSGQSRVLRHKDCHRRLQAGWVI